MKWQVRRLFFGDRRRVDRVVDDAKAALARLDRALASVERLAVDHDHDEGDKR